MPKPNKLTPDQVGPFGTRLRLIRTARWLSMAELGAQLGISAAAVCLYELGKNVPTKKRAREIADLLGVPADWLTGAGATFAYEATGVEAAESEAHDNSRFLYRSESDPMKLLQNVEFSDFELETLMRELKTLKRMASFLDITQAARSDEKRKVRETAERLAKAYAKTCDRINSILDDRARADEWIDRIDSAVDRDVFRRRYLQRQTYPEISAELGISTRILVYRCAKTIGRLRQIAWNENNSASRQEE